MKSCSIIFIVLGSLVIDFELYAQVTTPEEYQKKINSLRERVSTDAAVVLDASKPVDERIKAAGRIETVYDDAQVKGFTRLAADEKADPQLRQAALRKVLPHLGKDKEGLATLFRVAKDEQSDPGIRAAALDCLAVLDFSALQEPNLQTEYRTTLHSLTKSKTAEFKEQAYGALAAKQDEMVLKELKDGVLNPEKAPLTALKCIQFLAINPKPDLVKDLEPALAKYADNTVKAELLRLLPVSSTGREKVVEILQDRNQPDELRIAAVEGLAAAAPDRLATSVAAKPGEINSSIEVATAALEKLQAEPSAVSKLDSAKAAGISKVAKAFLADVKGDKEAKKAAWDYLKTNDQRVWKTESKQYLETTRDPDLKQYFSESLKK
jgi:hypothetical protein